jgi:hypothetical protein
MIESIENFEIEDLGIQEEWVYDIEVQDNHNFFGNNILLHNSVYLTIEPFMNMYMKKNPDLPMDDYVTWADNFEKKVIKPIVQKTIVDFAHELNAYNTDAIGCDREIIGDRAVFMAKKKYFARVLDDEGTRYTAEDPYIKKTGLELVKSSTPIWSKKYLEEAIPHILDKDEADLKIWFKEIKKCYTESNLNDIAAVGGLSSIDYDLDKDKGVPIGSRAAIVHNNYIEENNLTNMYTLIRPSDKCKKLFLRLPNKFNSNIIAYTNERFVNEIGDIIDFDTNFEKNFLKPLELMIDALGYRITKETEDLDAW